MRRDYLARFFTMHAENQDRQLGKAGRGCFGTGKSAAFAIADTLRISTVRDGRRSEVALTRAALDDAKSGDPVPVRTIADEERTGAANGTRVLIECLKKVRINRGEIERHLERHLRPLRGVVVELDGERIEPSVPPIDRTLTIVADEEAPATVRGRELTLHVAKAPLPEEDRGVAILASSVLHETTLAGAERKECSNYIFGEIDVPALSVPHDGVDAFDMARSGLLNRENQVVVDTLAFVGRQVEALRRELVEEAKARKEEADTARLQNEADKIARLINADYADYAQRFRPADARRIGGADAVPAMSLSGAGAEAFIAGGDQPAAVEIGEGPGGPERSDPVGPSGPDPHDGDQQAVRPAEEAATTAGRNAKVEPGKKRKSGGFDVRFAHNGAENPRCLYQAEERALIINLDHPQLVAARGEGVLDKPMFRKLAYEIAFTEYAIAISQESAIAGYYHDLLDPLFEVRSLMDRMARRAANAFAASAASG